MIRGELNICKATTIARAFVALLLAACAMAAFASSAQAAVFWGNHDAGRIGRAANDGTAAAANFIPAPAGPMGMAAINGTLYWADYDTGAIGRADVSGTAPADVAPAFITDIEGVFAVAVNADHLYWGTEFGIIGRAAINADGSLGTVERVFHDRAGFVEGLAIGDGEVYWSAFDTSKIGRITLAGDGSLAAAEDDLQTVNGAAGIALAGNSLYWANANGNSIGRAQIEADGTLSGVTQTFITGARDPAGIAVSAGEVFWTNSSSTQPPQSSVSRARLAGDGSVLSVQHELIFDNAGASGIAIDNSRDNDAPFITMSPLGPVSGTWFSGVSNPGGVQVDVGASDASGVASLRCTANGAPVLSVSGAMGSFTLGNGAHSISCTATDGASPANSGAAPGSAAFPVTLRVDLTAPSISCSAAPIDWVGSNAGFSCASSDGGSGLANGGDAQFFLVTSVPNGSADVAARSGTHDVSDVAGNTTTGGPFTASVDLAPPTLTCADEPALTQGGPATAVSATVADVGSGPASPAASGSTNTAELGDFTTVVTGFDRVGNSASVSCGYSVIAKPAGSKYTFKWLRNMRERSFRYGAHIPLRFRLWDADGRPVTKAVARLQVVSTGGGGAAAARRSRGRDRDIFRHLGRGHYGYLLDTRRLAGPGEYEVRVTLDDGSVQTLPLLLRARRDHRGHGRDED